MQTMYPGIINSPVTELAAAIDDAQTSFDVQDGATLPDAPNLAVIGQGAGAETVLYTTKTGNTLSGVTRGFQGAAAAHPLGTKVARNFTEYDYRALTDNIAELDDNVGDLGALNTTAKDNLVSAVNEVKGLADAAQGTADNAAQDAADALAEIDNRLQNDMIWRINNGLPEWSNDGGGTWNPVAAVKSIQKGVATVTAGPGSTANNFDITISAVGAKTSINLPFQMAFSGSTNARFKISGVLTTPTNLRITAINNIGSNGAESADVPWEVIEYY